MKIQFILSLLFIFLLSCKQKIIGQQTKSETPIHLSIQLETDKIFSDLTEVRRNFHENPELAGTEKKTQEFIKTYLVNLGIEVKTASNGYGIIGILKGSKKGKNIAWRAEMDALPNQFLGHSKAKGIQHNCGHDVHMAIALGIANVLSKNKDLLSGTVYFIFQPEEETFIGAKSMLESTLFSKINLSEIYGLHVTALPVGKIAVKPNEMFAYQRRIKIRLKNELSKEQIEDLTKKIHNALSRTTTETKPWEIQKMDDPLLGLANPNTIFKEYLIMDENFTAKSENGELSLEANVYETNFSNLKTLLPKIKQIVLANTYENQFLSVSFAQENPTVINDKKLTLAAVESLEKIYGKGLIATNYGQVPFFNDDFAYFQQQIPGVYFFLGGSNAEKGIVAMNHDPNFKVDEECIRVGIESFSSLLFERLKSK